jgi:hypothetical protein
MATIQGQINTPRDTTIQATNTALGLLGKDASLQDIKTALLAIVDAITPSIENDYDELTNKPQVNGVTLSGNKTSKQLGIRQTIPMNSASYAQLTSAEKMDPDKDYIITDINATSAPIDDNNTSNNKVWSSAKTDNTKADKEAILQTVEECSASTDPDDIAGAAALSSLNSALYELDYANKVDLSQTLNVDGATYTVPKKCIIRVLANTTADGDAYYVLRNMNIATSGYTGFIAYQRSSQQLEGYLNDSIVNIGDVIKCEGIVNKMLNLCLFITFK